MITFIMGLNKQWGGYIFTLRGYDGPLLISEATDLILNTRQAKSMINEDFLRVQNVPADFIGRLKTGFVEYFEDMEYLDRVFSCFWGLARGHRFDMESYCLHGLIDYLKGTLCTACYPPGGNECGDGDWDPFDEDGEMKIEEEEREFLECAGSLIKDRWIMPAVHILGVRENVYVG